MKNPLISVIVPVHNAEDFLEECIESILAQTYKNIEILLINDDSTDKSAEILEEYKKKDTRIKTFFVNEHNAAFTRKEGIEESEGEYVCFIDSDDIVGEDYVVKLHEAIVKQGTRAAAVKTSTFRVDVSEINCETDTGQVDIQKDTFSFFIDNYHSDEKNRFIGQSINAKMFYRSLLKSIDYSPIKSTVLEDNYTIPQILKEIENKGIALVEETLYFYRIHPKSTMQSILDKKVKYGDGWITYTQLFEEVMLYIEEIFGGTAKVKQGLTKLRAEKYFKLASNVEIKNKSLEQLREEKQVLESSQKDYDEINKELLHIKSSLSYRLGNKIALPFRFIKIQLQKFK